MQFIKLSLPQRISAARGMPLAIGLRYLDDENRKRVALTTWQLATLKLWYILWIVHRVLCSWTTRRIRIIMHAATVTAANNDGENNNNNNTWDPALTFNPAGIRTSQYPPFIATWPRSSTAALLCSISTTCCYLLNPPALCCPKKRIDALYFGMCFWREFTLFDIFRCPNNISV